MIRTLIRKEMLNQVLSIRFSILIALSFFVLIPSTWMMATHHGYLSREWGPHLTGGFSGRPGWYNLDRRIPVLRILAGGLDQEVTLRAEGSSHAGPQFDNRSFVHNPLQYFFSQLDFVFFVRIIGSLMAFVFTYDAVSGERQQGTLRLMMTNAISRPLFLLSKFLGSYLSFVVAFVPALVGVIIVLYLHPDVDLHSSDWWSVCSLFLLALLYICGFFMLGLFVSCITKQPKTTLTALMTIWVFLVLVIPSFSPFLAIKFRPVSSLYDVRTRIAALKEDVSQPFYKEWDDLYQGIRWEELSQSEREALREASRRIWYRRERVIMNLCSGEIMQIRLAFINDMRTQVRMSQYISLVSPSVALTYVASDIAHTGIESEWNFRRAVLLFRGQFLTEIDAQMERTEDYEELWENKSDEYAPPFEYAEPDLIQVIHAHLPRFIVLMFYPILFFLGAQIAFIRSAL